jgi:hypothetical protein
VAEWKSAAQATIADWVASMNDAGFDGQALVDEAQALIAKNTQ